MGLATALARRVERRWQTIADLDALMDRAYGGSMGLSAAGRDVSVQTALQYSTVWACVRAIAETVASLPCITYRRRADGGKERAVTHRLYDVLHYQPNPEMTSMDYWETVLTHTLTWGNHYSEIERDGYGAKALWPLEPSRITPMRDSAGNLYYEYRQRAGSPKKYAFADIFHVHGLSWNGLIGLSVIGYARETIGLGLSLDEFASRYFGNGSDPGGWLKVPGQMSAENKERMKADWEALHQGPLHSHRVAVLDNNVEFHQMTIPPEDSQFLQSRQFQAEEIARWYRVPQHKVGLLNKATFSNIEQQAIEFVVDCIRPWCYRIEQAIRRDVFQISDGKRDHFVEFLVDGLLRGDLKSRYDAYAVARQNGWMNGDEIREKENQNPMPDGQGKVFWAPQNMQSAERMLEPPEPPAPPPTPPQPAAEEPQTEPTQAPNANGAGVKAGRT